MYPLPAVLGEGVRGVRCEEGGGKVDRVCEAVRRVLVELDKNK